MSKGNPPTETTTSPDESLAAAVERAAELLPAQGPIGVFIHHNPLHAFEDETFEDAVVHAGALLDCEPYLPERDYRAELNRGRITRADVVSELERELGERGDDIVVARLSRRELQLRILLHGYDELSGAALHWLLAETDAGRRIRDDLPEEAREVWAPWAETEASARAEKTPAGKLWQACVDQIANASAPQARDPDGTRRLRDAVLDRCGVDIDELIDPLLIRFLGAFLDQGLADWPMPGRASGIYHCFLELLSRPLSILSGPWVGELRKLVADDRRADRDAWSSLASSLADLGVGPDQRTTHLIREALALRGWAGMIRQLELRPDRAPTVTVPARLVDYLAVRYLLLRAAARHGLACAKLSGSLAQLGATIAEDRAPSTPPAPADRAWPLFQVAQLCGLTADSIRALSAGQARAFEQEIAAFDSLRRRRILHLAYERHLRHRLYDALAQHSPRRPDAPAYQAAFCIDEREESFRRHLEETDPECETFGVAGFYGVAMYYQGEQDARPRPLCPVAIEPAHYVTSAPADERSTLARWRRFRRHVAGTLNKNVHLGSRRFVAGAVLMASLGVLWSLPLVLRVLFPRLGQRIRAASPRSERARPRLLLDRDDAATPPLGQHVGFSVDEMAAIVRAQLEQSAIASRLAPLIFIIGHGSTSQNNPHRSVYDCGACGGSAGGPNARAFAAMANDVRVREHLAATGLLIPEGCHFVGGERNTTNNDLQLYDTDRVPTALHERFERAVAAFERTRRREAHERCRRFHNFHSWMSANRALEHVRVRAADIAQTRPEYGHCTNAFCIVGRRERTRGLFLDRRAFLVSFDPTGANAEQTLAQLLRAVVPVVMGINLEYFFGRIDPTGYGCGTKLPHNVVAMLGVMNGPASDLRTGLHWQTLELHEPVRLSLVVEADPELVERVLAADERLDDLVQKRWISLAALSPDDGQLWTIEGTSVRAHAPERPLARITGASKNHYRGARGHLPFVAIVDAGPRPSEHVQ